MPTSANSPPAPGTSHAETRRPPTAELQFLLIAIVFIIMMLLAGVPGELNKAGDGSPALQRGWAERHTAEVAAQQAAASGVDATGTAPLPAPDSER